MLLTGIQCETCTKNHIEEDTGTWRRHDLPSDWLILFAGDPQHTIGWHFCSKLCLADWIEKYAAVEKLQHPGLQPVEEGA